MGEGGSRPDGGAAARLNILLAAAEENDRLFAAEPVVHVDLDPYPAEPAKRQTFLSTTRSLLDKVVAVDTSSLSHPTQLTHARLHARLRDDAANLSQNVPPITWQLDHTDATEPFGLLKALRDFGRVELDSPEALQPLLDRVERFPDWTIDTLGTMRQAIRNGEPLPTQLVMQEFRQKLHIFLHLPALTAFSQPFAAAQNTAPSWQQRYTLANQHAFQAYESWDALIQDHINSFRGDDHLGLCHLPGGEADYQRRVEYFASLDAVDIGTVQHAVQASLAQVEELITGLSALPKLRPTTARSLEGLLDAATKRYEYFQGRGDQKLHSYQGQFRAGIKHIFSRSPVPLEAYIDTGVTAQANLALSYYTAPLRAELPGLYAITPFAPNPVEDYGLGFYNHRDKKTMEDRSRHGLGELWYAYGTHLLISRELELPEVSPALRGSGRNPAFREGWSGYFESMITRDIDLKTDIWGTLVLLGNERRRLRQALLDIGMHHEGWTLNQAREHGYRRDLESILEVVACPGKALAYPLGRAAMLEARLHAQQELGGDLDLIWFHDIMLGQGSMPLRLLLSHVKWHVAQEVPLTRG